LTEKNALEKEKNELEVQSQEYFKQIDKLTANYVNIKIQFVYYFVKN